MLKFICMNVIKYEDKIAGNDQTHFFEILHLFGVVYNVTEDGINWTSTCIRREFEEYRISRNITSFLLKNFQQRFFF